MKPQDPSSDSKAMKTTMMDEVLGIKALDFGLGNVLTPKSSIQNLQQQSNVRHTFNELMQSLHPKTQKANEGMNDIPILQQFDEVVDNVGTLNEIGTPIVIDKFIV